MSAMQSANTCHLVVKVNLSLEATQTTRASVKGGECFAEGPASPLSTAEVMTAKEAWNIIRLESWEVREFSIKVLVYVLVCA